MKAWKRRALWFFSPAGFSAAVVSFAFCMTEIRFLSSAEEEENRAGNLNSAVAAAQLHSQSLRSFPDGRVKLKEDETMTRQTEKNPSVRVLPSSIAGSWYPGTKEALLSLIASYLEALPPSSSLPPPSSSPENKEESRGEEEPSGGNRISIPNILILPHAGYEWSGKTAAYGIRRVEDASFRRVIVLAPSHHAYLRNSLCIPAGDAASTPLGVLPFDREGMDMLGNAPEMREGNGECSLLVSDRIHLAEHAAQIQYPFLQYALRGGFETLPVIVGELDGPALKTFAALLRPLLDDQTLLVISSDFTHFGADFAYCPFRRDVRNSVEKLDRSAFERIRDGSLVPFLKFMEETGATICGKNPLALMLSLIPPGTEMELLHYATSSDESGDFSRFVCYLSAAGYADWKKETQKKKEEFLTSKDRLELLRIARRAIVESLKSVRSLSFRRADCPSPEELLSSPDALSPAMREKMGAFVTLQMRSNGMLRGCIGEIEPFRPLYEAVAARAADAAFRDPRFPPLSPGELSEIEIEISALTPPRPVKSYKEIEIGRHGMTLSKYGRSAVFLPQVAPEQGWTLEETLTHLAMKAGLKADDWRENAEFTVFEAVVFRESDFPSSSSSLPEEP